MTNLFTSVATKFWRTREAAPAGGDERLQTALQQAEDTLQLMTERISDLEHDLGEQGWRRMTVETEHEFSRAGLRQICAIARVMSIKNPLIKRGLAVQSHYVWAQGANIQARHPEINQLVQAFLDEQKNKVELTSPEARMMKDRELSTDGNIFFVFFINRSTGHIQLRSIPVAEIEDIICNPQDAKEPRYYKRIWTEEQLDQGSGEMKLVQRTAYYPDWQYTPSARPMTIGSAPVLWTSPVYHVKVGAFSDWKFGLSEVYAAIDWARAYKEMLENWATITKAYARFAFQATTPGGKKGVQAAAQRFGTTAGSAATHGRETNPPPPAGSTLIGGEGTKFDPVRTAGATTKMEDARRLLLMVAAVLNLPETFFGDASVGSLATAKSLDRPTELAMKARQTLWTGIFSAILNFVIFWAVKAPRGELRSLGTIERDPITGHEQVRWRIDPATIQAAQDGQPAQPGSPYDAHVDIDFPPIVEIDTKERIEAIDKAAEHVPDQMLIARLVLGALGEDDVDEILDKIFNEDGSLKQAAPQPSPDGQAGIDPATPPTASPSTTEEPS